MYIHISTLFFVNNQSSYGRYFYMIKENKENDNVQEFCIKKLYFLLCYRNWMNLNAKYC